MLTKLRKTLLSKNIVSKARKGRITVPSEIRKLKHEMSDCRKFESFELFGSPDQEQLSYFCIHKSRKDMSHIFRLIIYYIICFPIIFKELELLKTWINRIAKNWMCCHEFGAGVCFGFANIAGA